jgi:mannose-6-phosphate isomerase-like protein (cupin superfamily)
MQVVKKTATKKFTNSKSCTAIEYPMEDPDINGAVGKINGRYPEEGRVVNEVCKELGYVIKGSGRVVIEGREIELKKGDLILIQPGERYYWEGNLKLFMPCTPAWSPQQHKEVD